MVKLAAVVSKVKVTFRCNQLTVTKVVKCHYTVGLPKRGFSVPNLNKYDVITLGQLTEIYYGRKSTSKETKSTRKLS
ncbi:UNVERIFIED_CONTAM: hypothetical protein GTU68_040754 [Idotea baltica]|nr:hypothetical protein [Idotea baltica]